ncbi:MAG: hypothetical protein NVS2B7_21000 [Herpetosiphon sp.]
MSNFAHVLELAEQLPPTDQRQLVAALNAHLPPLGVPGRDLVAAIQALNLDPAAVDEMERAIEEGYERIDPADWQ